jgi:Ca2+/H+ antiporter, TMEM165/GDT1 family
VDLSLFATVFGVIFVAELPDKTALAAVVMATRNRAAPVFLGATLALTVQSIIAVAAGTLFSRLPEKWVQLGAGLLFVGCALVMFFKKHEDEATKSDDADEPRGFLRTLWKVFAVVFVAEWGDLTQLGTAGFQAKYHQWLTVLTASCLALWAVAAIAVFVGNRAAKLMSPKVTSRVAAVLFAVIGVVMLVKAARAF